MTSAELRRIVGAIPTIAEHAVDDALGELQRQAGGSYCPQMMLEVRGAGIRSVRANFIARTLANHADALVKLVEACERLAAYELQGMDLGVGARGSVLAMRNALVALHAIKEQP